MSRILVVKTSKIFSRGIWEGFKRPPFKEIVSLIVNHGEYKERSSVETDENYQQIIVRVILKVGSKVFVYKIAEGSSEKRIHKLWTIFLGGHIEQSDFNIRQARDREFEEEIDYHGKILNKKFLGLIKLHDNPVNRVHIGLIWLYVGDSEEFESTSDKGLLAGQFVNVNGLKKYKGKLSYWTKLFLPHLIKSTK